MGESERDADVLSVWDPVGQGDADGEPVADTDGHVDAEYEGEWLDEEEKEPEPEAVTVGLALRENVAEGEYEEEGDDETEEELQ